MTAEQTYQLDRQYVFHSWSAQQAITPLVITDAAGSYVTDGDGNRLLDLSSQLVNTNIGHQHPKVVEAIKRQADLLCTVAPQHANAARGEAARLIIERAPDSMAKVFFTNGGAEAVEYAIRMARLHTGRQQGALDLPQLPRRHPDRGQRHRRPAALAERPGHRRRRCTSSARSCTGRPFHAETEAAGMPAGAWSTWNR